MVLLRWTGAVDLGAAAAGGTCRFQQHLRAHTPTKVHLLKAKAAIGQNPQQPKFAVAPEEELVFKNASDEFVCVGGALPAPPIHRDD